MNTVPVKLTDDQSIEYLLSEATDRIAPVGGHTSFYLNIEGNPGSDQHWVKIFMTLPNDVSATFKQIRRLPRPSDI